jgi:catechol 2,3-dioxygenase-like lactoylglutathione lyase family enzyme
MTPRLYRVIILVSDIAAAEKFYAAVLGTPGTRVSDGRHYFDCGGTILACLDPRADGDDYPPASTPDWLYFAVENLEATFAACLAAGARPADGAVHGAPAGAIARRPWGERSFYVLDLFGNKLCFVDQTTVFTGS